jgi:hypothetical protein
MLRRARAGARPAALASLVVWGTLAYADAGQAWVLDLISAENRAILAGGRAVTELLKEPAVDLTIAAAVRSRVTPEIFVAGFRDIERIQKGTYTPLLGRFSSPPRIEDLATLTLDAEDLEDLRDCRPRRCGLKLSAAEIQQIRSAIGAAGSQWKDAALDAFRRALVRRASDFVAHGRARLIPYEDDDEAVLPRSELEQLLAVLQRRAFVRPDVLAYLRTYPSSSSGPESYLFWSKDTLGDAKPIVSITHAAVVRDEQDAPVAVMTQVYASHYLNASISITTLVPASDGTPQIVYLRLSKVDVFEGAIGGMVRRIVQKRVRAEGPAALESMRRKLEGLSRAQ